MKIAVTVKWMKTGVMDEWLIKSHTKRDGRNEVIFNIRSYFVIINGSMSCSVVVRGGRVG